MIYSLRALSLAASLMALASTESASAESILLEGFEKPNLAAQQFTYNPIGSDWNFSGTTGRGLQRNGSGWGAAAAPEGQQTAFLQGGDARLSQMVPLQAGCYTVSFYAAKRAYDTTGTNPIQVKINGNPIGKAITPTSTAFAKYTTDSFMLSTNGYFTLELDSTNRAAADYVTFVDRIEITPVQTDKQSSMTIRIAKPTADNIIRNDISKRTFGSGIQFNSSQLRWTMDNLDNPNDSTPPVSSITADTFKWLNLGTLRFPSGDSSFLYIAGNPQASYPTLDHVDQWNRYLTPDEIVTYTGPNRLNLERLFEVNTAFWLDYNDWQFKYLDTNMFNKPYVGPSLNTVNMSIAAQKAAEWVAKDQGQTQLWEIGNEDWSRWNPEQYAEIYSTFQAKMKSAKPVSSPGIKFLAQGLMESYGTNTPASWLAALRSKLQATGQVKDVYGYSIHRYLRGGIYPNNDPIIQRQMQTQDMLATVADETPINDLKTLLGSSDLNAPTHDWKIWMTEFNVHQPTGRKNAKGEDTFEILQDMGHALVIADWTGKMLEQNIDRLFMHSLDNSPEFSLVQYDNGSDIEHPRVTVPGYAYSIYAQAFGKTMLRNSIDNNVNLTAPNNKTYPQLSAYSSISADGKSLRVIAINRHMTQNAKINIVLPGVRASSFGRLFSFRQLRANQITDNNIYRRDVVKWSDAINYHQSDVGVEQFQLDPASVNLFIIPL